MFRLPEPLLALAARLLTPAPRGLVARTCRRDGCDVPVEDGWCSQQCRLIDSVLGRRVAS